MKYMSFCLILLLIAVDFLLEVILSPSAFVKPQQYIRVDFFKVFKNYWFKVTEFCFQCDSNFSPNKDTQRSSDSHSSLQISNTSSSGNRILI